MDIYVTIWLATAFMITAIISRVAKGRIANNPAVRKKPVPPVVTGGSMIIRLAYTLMTKGLEAGIHDLYTKLGSVFTVNFMGRKMTFLVGPEVSGHFFQGPESEISHGKSLEFTVPMFGQHVAHAVSVAVRNEQTRFMVDAFKPSKLRFLVGLMVQEVESYFAGWGAEGTVDLKRELEQVFMLIAARCLLGKEVRDRMLGEVLGLLHELTENSLGLTSVLFPYAPTPANRRRDKAHAVLSELFTKIVRSRSNKSTSSATGDNDSKDGDRVDVLQNLIDTRYRDGRATTEGEVTGMILCLLLAGGHTSSTASTWTGAHLLGDPTRTWLAAAVEEQRRVMEKHGGGYNREQAEEVVVDYDILGEMNVLHRCIKEALRMYPPLSTFFRTVHCDFTVRTREGVEFEIPSGHVAASPVVLNSNLPHIYRDPQVFDPDRFGPGREEDRVGGRFSYTAFGGGRHACLGENYAYLQIKAIWSHLLRNFELELVSAFPDRCWSKVGPEPKGKVMVRYKRRSLSLSVK